MRGAAAIYTAAKNAMLLIGVVLIGGCQPSRTFTYGPASGTIGSQPGSAIPPLVQPSEGFQGTQSHLPQNTLSPLDERKVSTNPQTDSHQYKNMKIAEAIPAAHRPAAGTRIIAPEMKPMYFNSGQSTLNDKQKDQLYFIAQWILSNPNTKILVQGHSDAIGKKEDQEIVAMQRAQTVTNYLSENNGVDRSRLEPIGYGSSMPDLTDSQDPTAHKGRRVDFCAIYQ